MFDLNWPPLNWGSFVLGFCPCYCLFFWYNPTVCPVSCGIGSKTESIAWLEAKNKAPSIQRWGNERVVVNHYFGSGGNKKLLLLFCMVGIIREFRQAPTQPPPQTSSPWWAVCPPYGVDSMNCPNPTRGRPFSGVGQGRCRGVLYRSINQACN